MRIDSKQSADCLRTIGVLAICLAVWANTSGAALVIHLHECEKHAEHDSDDCNLCQQLMLSKRLLIEPAGELPGNVPVLRWDVPMATESIRDSFHSASQPRAPPFIGRFSA